MLLRRRFPANECAQYAIRNIVPARRFELLQPAELADTSGWIGLCGISEATEDNVAAGDRLSSIARRIPRKGSVFVVGIAALLLNSEKRKL